MILPVAESRLKNKIETLPVHGAGFSRKMAVSGPIDSIRETEQRRVR